MVSNDLKLPDAINIPEYIGIKTRLNPQHNVIEFWVLINNSEIGKTAQLHIITADIYDIISCCFSLTVNVENK